MVALGRVGGRIRLQDPNNDGPVKRVLDGFPDDGPTGLIELFKQFETVAFYLLDVHSAIIFLILWPTQKTGLKLNRFAARLEARKLARRFFDFLSAAFPGLQRGGCLRTLKELE
jgi:hypothetical protein